MTGPDYVDTLSKVAQYLVNKGFSQRQSDEWGLFSITARGISEVEEILPSSERQRGDASLDSSDSSTFHRHHTGRVQ